MKNPSVLWASSAPRAVRKPTAMPWVPPPRNAEPRNRTQTSPEPMQRPATACNRMQRHATAGTHLQKQTQTPKTTPLPNSRDQPRQAVSHRSRRASSALQKLPNLRDRAVRCWKRERTSDTKGAAGIACLRGSCASRNSPRKRHATRTVGRESDGTFSHARTRRTRVLITRGRGLLPRMATWQHFAGYTGYSGSSYTLDCRRRVCSSSPVPADANPPSRSRSRTFRRPVSTGPRSSTRRTRQRRSRGRPAPAVLPVRPRGRRKLRPGRGAGS